MEDYSCWKLKSSLRDKAALKGFSQYVQNKLFQISKIHTSYQFSIKKVRKIFSSGSKHF